MVNPSDQHKEDDDVPEIRRIFIEPYVECVLSSEGLINLFTNFGSATLRIYDGNEVSILELRQGEVVTIDPAPSRLAKAGPTGWAYMLLDTPEDASQYEHASS